MAIKKSKICCFLVILSALATRVHSDDFDYVGYISPNKQASQCTALRLNDKWAMTAAHCLVGFKANQLLITFPVQGANISRIKSFELHPEFASKTLVGNIALIELADNIGLKNKPKLPAKGEKVTDTAKLVGFMTMTSRSYPGQLSMKLNTNKSLPIKSLATCRNQFALNVIQDGMLCAGFEFEQAGLCYGGAGSGLVQVIDGQHIIFGLGSFGFDCGKGRYSSIFTDLGFYFDWIQNKISG